VTTDSLLPQVLLTKPKTPIMIVPHRREQQQQHLLIVITILQKTEHLK
jgi:hypothetical protein